MIGQSQFKNHQRLIGGVAEGDVGALPLTFGFLFDDDSSQS